MNPFPMPTRTRDSVRRRNARRLQGWVIAVVSSVILWVAIAVAVGALGSSLP